MSDNTNSSTAEKQDLQIETALSQLTLSTADSSLTTATDSSLTTPTSSARGFFTSAGSSENEQESFDQAWRDFYTRVNRTPPKATRNTDFGKTVATAEKLLKLSDSEEFQNKSFNDLTTDQQSIMVFMIVKEMHKVFGASDYLNAKALINALYPDTVAHKRMMSFIRLGGDRTTPIGSQMQRSYTSYIDKLPEWKAKTATTIFKKNPDMAPFIHIQNDESYICTYTACSILLYYISYNNKRNVGAENMDTIKMNISRFIRDEVSGEQIANFTLTDMKGAYLEKVLLGLLQSFGTDDCQEFEKISTRKNTEGMIYRSLEVHLKDGCPLVFSCEALPAFTNYKKLQYTGKVSDYLNGCDRPDKPKDRRYHALTCVGIKPRNGVIPPMLLVQDSSHRRPFFSIGLDLLMDMDMANLQFYTVPDEWTFNQKMDYVVKPETRSLLSGSPMSLDNNGVPLVAKKPRVERPDMSRYLDKLPRHDPSIAYVFET